VFAPRDRRHLRADLHPQRRQSLPGGGIRDSVARRADAIVGYLLIGTDNTARQEVEEERKKLDQGLRDQQFYTRSLIESNIDHKPFGSEALGRKIRELLDR
jgi:hypothetical protein